MGFSWENVKKRTISKKLYRARILAGGGSKEQQPNPDFAVMHPDWVRDVNTANISRMNKTVQDDIEKRQKFALDRRLRRVGKD